MDMDKQLKRVLRQAEIMDDDIDDLIRIIKHFIDGYYKLGGEIRKLKNEDLEDDIYEHLDLNYQAIVKCYEMLDNTGLQDYIQTAYEYFDEQ